MQAAKPRFMPGIWWCAFGYFACYVPYSALTKAVSDGLLSGQSGKLSGFQMLPATTLASLVGMLVFLLGTGLWRFAGRRRVLGLSIPVPGLWTFLSGLCSAAIIGTTTLAYTFSGCSIVFMMLLMRGGVLILAPIVDLMTGRRVRWFSWVALLLSLDALVVSFAAKASTAITLIAAIDVLIYLGSYFIRLRLMSRMAKSDDVASSARYFVEEQLVAVPAIVIGLGVCALIDAGPILHEIRQGFATIRTTPVLREMILIGLLSQGTGIFGGLILLDKRENSFCVPVNRASSVLAGLCATVALALWLGRKMPPPHELIGALLIIEAILVLTLPGLLERRRLTREAAAAAAKVA